MSIAVIGAVVSYGALHYAISQKYIVPITSRQPKNIKNFVSLEVALVSEYFIFALPAQVVRGWLRENFVFRGQKILVAAKGIEQGSGQFLNEIFAEYVPEDHLAFLSGPSFASEVMQGLPTAVVINSTDETLSKEFSTFFPSFMKNLCFLKM